MSTIAAISTATGAGGIGIIRMSGEKSFEILQKIFQPTKKFENKDIKGYSIKFGYIIDKNKNEKVDEVLVSFFKNPKSYTKEDMCEINSHGGIIIERKILELCLKNGAEIAEPGEFTKRAFLNGRIDLTQAESVIDIINSKTNKEAEASINQLEGKLSNEIKSIKKKLLDIMADIEASIDYPEYDIEELSSEQLLNKIFEIKQELILLKDSFNSGKILREGIKTIIIGKPNSGKSSLLNYILNEERAIVSDVPGTTRDTIEEFITIQGIPLKIIDTAGIRNTSDKIEEIGVKRALKLAEEADLIIAIFDGSKKLDNEDFEILELIKEKNAIIINNKIDLENSHVNAPNLKNINKTIVDMSTKNKIGINALYDEILKMFRVNEININDGVIITNIRHKNQLEKAIESLEESIKSIEIEMPVDITSVYIKQIISELNTITGENVSEDIINEIFSKFCLGK